MPIKRFSGTYDLTKICMIFILYFRGYLIVIINLKLRPINIIYLSIIVKLLVLINNFCINFNPIGENFHNFNFLPIISDSIVFVYYFFQRNECLNK